MSPNPVLPSNSPKRPIIVREAIEAEYDALVRRIVKKGVAEEEVAVAIECLAQAHLDSIAAGHNTADEIDHVRANSGLPPELPQLRNDSWVMIGGALIWCLVGAGGLVAVLGMLGRL